MGFKRAHWHTVLAIVIMSLAGSALSAQALEPGTDPFERTWSRTDRPVADNAVQRTWMWGPGGFTAVMYEPFTASPDGVRMVQYFDKSRMEITDPSGDPNSIWYVTNGLLVVEMVEGHIKMGLYDEEIDDSPDPAEVNIAGDPGERPTYADINRLDLRNVPATPEGTIITATFGEDNTIGNDPTHANAGVTAGYRLTVTDVFGNVTVDHTVASPFWAFMNSTGTVWDGSSYTQDQLFVNPFYATGYPITEAYWSKIAVSGQTRDVLWQCFERRCLTYTPTNDPTWQVEMGNVGQHYYRWRYNTEIPSEPPAIVEADYQSMGPAPLADYDETLAGESYVTIGNQSPYTMTITFDGPVSYTMTIPPCPTCIVYPAYSGPDGCMDEIEWREVTLPVGNYRVKLDTDGENVSVGRGHWTLTPDSVHGSCYFIQETPAPTSSFGDGPSRSVHGIVQ